MRRLCTNLCAHPVVPLSRCSPGCQTPRARARLHWACKYYLMQELLLMPAGWPGYVQHTQYVNGLS